MDSFSDIDLWYLRAILHRSEIPDAIRGRAGQPVRLLAKLIHEHQTNPDHVIALLGDETATRMFMQPMNPTHLLNPPEEPLIYVPALPDNCQLSADDEEAALDMRTHHWLNAAYAWCFRRSPTTPRIMIEGGLVWLIGMIAAGRSHLNLDFASIGPHLYMLWVAPSSRYRKSTGLNAIEALAMQTAPHLMLPSNTTPEMLAYKLSGKLPSNFDKLKKDDQEREKAGQAYAAKRAIIVDEASQLFSDKQYMQGLRELIMMLYDPRPEIRHERHLEGQIIIRYPHPSILGATTTIKVSRIRDEAWSDGIFARFAMLSPDGPPPPEPDTARQSQHFDPPESVLEPLHNLHTRLGSPSDDHAIDIDDLALAAWNHYKRFCTETSEHVDYRIEASYARLPTQLLKVASALALIDWQPTATQPGITMKHYSYAQQIVERWRASLHHLLVDVTKTEDQLAMDEILTFLERKRSSASRSEIMRACKLRAQTVNNVLAILLDSGDITTEPSPLKPSSFRFRLDK